MLFNSIDFAVFLPLVFIIYWLLGSKQRNAQNLCIIAASYFFYAWWDWRFLSLLAISTIVDYLVGKQLSKSTHQTRRKILLYTSICVNLGFLGFFKYYNFFIDSFVSAFQFFGSDISSYSLYIILPVGISFYTFQTLSYTIDVYKKNMPATQDFIAFTAFVSFFPQLVAGPIERAKHLLPQFLHARCFDYTKAIDGLKQITWGLFKKIVIADSCAVYVNDVFANYQDYNGSTLVLGAVLFSIQIYGDFSGYSDIAIGTARLFGFTLMKNFNFPYFSKNIAEFWRRWHISLTTWFRDYVYIPLGGSRGNIYKTVRNVSIVFLVSGFWHGANWTFIAWGVIHAFFYVPIVLFGKNKTDTNPRLSNSVFLQIFNALLIVKTFILVSLAWILFRSNTIVDAWYYLVGIGNASLFLPIDIPIKYSVYLLIGICFMFEWIGKEQEYALEKIGLQWHISVKYVFYILIIACIIFFGNTQQEFIYFQF